MGLFSSNKPPQPPLPHLAIQIDDPADKVFRPEDMVTGHIEFTPVQPIAPSAINVSLFGQSLIWHRIDRGSSDATDWHHYRDNAPLFEDMADALLMNRLARQEKELESFQPGQTYKFPFQFRFPTSTGNSRLGQYENDGDEKYIAGPHQLPPTFLITGRHGDGTDADYAKIEYGIRAKLVCPGIGVVQGKDLIDLTTTSTLQFQPNASPLQRQQTQLRHPKIFTLQSSILTGDDDKINFRQAIVDRFSSSTPRLTFEAALELPTLLTPGSEFHFRACFAAFSQTENVMHIPAVTFTVLKLDLYDFTFYRASRDMEATNWRDGAHKKNKYANVPAADEMFSGTEHEEYVERKTHLNSLPESTTLELPYTQQRRNGEEKKQEQQHDRQPSRQEEEEKTQQSHRRSMQDHQRTTTLHARKPSEEGRRSSALERISFPNPFAKERKGSAESKKSSSSSAKERKSSADMEQARDCHVWFTARMPSGTTPSFRSFAVTRAYRLRVKLGVEVGGKKFEVEGESQVEEMG